MNILGISCWYHDAAACLVRDGRIVAAAQEERFSRKKHDASFPRRAIAYCLREGGIDTSDLDVAAFYDKPFLKFERLLETYVATAPRGLRSFVKAMPLWLKEKLWIPDRIAKELDFDGPIVFPEHHESHAASAFYPSPFERAAFLTTDGVGEWATTSFGVGDGARLRILAEQHFPHSLGLLYSAFTYFTGFKVNSGEYKLMGLAPYGEPRFVDAIREHLIDVKADGSFRLNMDYFTYAHGLRMTGRRFAELFGGPRRAPESPLTRREMDLARSVQAVTEEVMLRMARHVHRVTGERRLCLAGGVALNCVANGRLLREGPFDALWIQPAAGDAGGAIGAALTAWHQYLGHNRPAPDGDAMRGAYLGPAFSDDEVAAFLEREGIPHTRHVDEAALTEAVAEMLAEGKVVGWFQGRMEFGPRALGNRSILADPRGRDVQRTVNLKIKFRESFRPFAPSVTAERASEYFELDGESPYMLLVAPVRGARAEGEGLDRLGHVASPIPAVTHVDGSARIQTVRAATNPLFHRLLSAFEVRTGCPVLVNTSFNVRGEPIVCTPEDAYRCFRRTHMDALVLGSHIVTKAMLPDPDAEVLTAETAAETYGLD
ncbi:carbamoyltransferase family protein [Rhodocaloribacter sp.]